jgi:hypothetical protein
VQSSAGERDAAIINKLSSSGNEEWYLVRPCRISSVFEFSSIQIWRVQWWAFPKSW